MKNKSDIQVMLKEAGILFVITLLAGLLLGFIYELTKEPIALQRQKAVQKACAAVFEEAASFESLQYELQEETVAKLAEEGVEIGTIFKALGADGSKLGYVVQSTSGEGYGGDIVLYVGIKSDGTLNGISLLEINETPGLGMKAQEVLVPQFRNKKVAVFTYTKTGSSSDTEIDAISGATVTTEAVTEAVNGGLLVAQELMQGGAVNE